MRWRAAVVRVCRCVRRWARRRRGVPDRQPFHCSFYVELPDGQITYMGGGSTELPSGGGPREILIETDRYVHIRNFVIPFTQADVMIHVLEVEGIDLLRASVPAALFSEVWLAPPIAWPPARRIRIVAERWAD